ncbi:MAG: hypothetical protein QOF33_1178, partial [Thermomicrobiales bacterium]|nr:hypothetical protein [Thermomicrobiales bacterium]
MVWRKPVGLLAWRWTVVAFAVVVLLSTSGTMTTEAATPRLTLSAKSGKAGKSITARGTG